jgi:hypothetical protein
MKQIDWNEASRQGLIERINTEILHPLGLAMCRTPEDGTSPGLLIAEDGQWEYAQGTPGILPTVTAERDQLQIEVRALCKTVEYSAMRIKELDLLFGRYLLAMRAAVIDEECGGHGMKWIYNALRGPGELPPENEENAQAYFDREVAAIDAGMVEVLAFFDPKPLSLTS